MIKFLKPGTVYYNHLLLSPAPLQDIGEPSVPLGNYTEDEFNDRVNQIKEYVRSGDVIQTVLSQSV